MNFDGRLRRYGKGQFTDQDITRCTGLSRRAWRELIRLRVVRTVTEDRGRGVVRLCDASALKRTALIGAINRAGWSLAVSGQIAYFLPFHTLLFECCDPYKVLLQTSAEVDPKTGLPPRVKLSKLDWFDRDKRACADPESDWLLEIYEGRFVGAVYNAKEPPTIFGDLRNMGASFVAWFPFQRRIHSMGIAMEAFMQELPPRIVDFAAQWEDPTKWTTELKQIAYKYERHDRDDDPLCMAAQRAANSPDFRTTINITLAIRKALRRYMGIEPTGPSFEL